MESRRSGGCEPPHRMQGGGQAGGGKARNGTQDRRAARLGLHQMPGETGGVAPRPAMPNVADDHRPAASSRASIAASAARTRSSAVASTLPPV